MAESYEKIYKPYAIKMRLDWIEETKKDLELLYAVRRKVGSNKTLLKDINDSIFFSLREIKLTEEELRELQGI